MGFYGLRKGFMDVVLSWDKLGRGGKISFCKDSYLH